MPSKSVEYERTSPLESQFKVMNKVTDSTFGEVCYAQNPKTNQWLIIKEKFYSSQSDFKKEVNRIKKRITLNHDGLVPL